VSAEIIANTDYTNADVRLIGGAGGIFEIRKEGELIWKKVKSGVFPQEGEILEILKTL